MRYELRASSLDLTCPFKFSGERSEIGVLRLRMKFASRPSCSAQDDILLGVHRWHGLPATELVSKMPLGSKKTTLGG